MAEKKERIWELDALRGLCILGMLVVHLVYDLVDLYGLVNWEYPPAFTFVQRWGGVLFLLISGISVTLGRHHVRRGLIVLGCGFICTAVTAGMYFLGFAGKGMIIYFGVLHCLGACMLLWQPVKKLPSWALAVLGVLFAAVGLWIVDPAVVEVTWLIPLGLKFPGFRSSDYFPLLPYFGFFLLGAVLGKTIYRKKQTRFPKVRQSAPVIAFLRLCGKHSLWIYLLHQPVLSGVLYLVSLAV